METYPTLWFNFGMFTTIAGLKIEYSQKGSGKDILLLHGWGGSLESLSNLQDELSEKYNVVNISLPGFGNSEAPKSAWSLKNYSLFIEELILKLKLKKTVIAGHSFGGKIALQFALDFPELIDSLIIMSPSGIKPKNSIKKLVLGSVAKVFGALTSILPRNLKEKIRSGFYKFVVREGDYLKAGAMKETLSKVVNEHLDKKLEFVTVPTKILWAEKDTYVPLWMGKKMHSLIPNSTFEVLENETHGFPIKNPNLVAKLITKY